MNIFTALCAKGLSALSIFSSLAPSDPTILRIGSLPQHEQAIYWQVRTKGAGGVMTGWETARTLSDYFREMGAFQFGMMSSLQRLIYGDGVWREKAAARWLDVGSGAGQALEDLQKSYEAGRYNVNHGAEIVGIEPNFSPGTYRGKFLGGPISIQSGEIVRGADVRANPNIKLSVIPKFFEEVPDSDLGKFGIITSIRAATYYSPQITFVINKMLRARAIVNRTIFDVHSEDVVRTTSGEIPLTEWLLRKLKPIVAHVEATPSFEHPKVTFFQISDTSLVTSSGQIPDLKFVEQDKTTGRRIFSE